MTNNPYLLLGAIIVPILMLSAAVCIDHPTAPHPVKQATVYEQVGYPVELQQRLMEQLERDNLLDAVEHVESHGNPNAVSPKGAKGRYQLMDGTVKKPGMGVVPLRNHSQKEQKRFAREYLDALIRHYHGNVKLALAAYNGGVGLVDRTIAMLPKETREYVEKVQQFAENGE